MKQLKEIPKFANEDEEREFWSTHSFTDYIDPKSWKRGSPKTNDRMGIELSPEMTKQVERLSRERKMSMQEIVLQLLASGLKQQGIQPGA